MRLQRWRAAALAGVAFLTSTVQPSQAAQGAPKATEWTVESPDGALAFTLRLDGTGALTYTVARRTGAAGTARSEVLRPSPLGVRREDQAFERDLKLMTAGPVVPIDESYTVPHGKRQTIKHQARQQTITFANASGRWLDVIVRVANDGAAFRYRFVAKERDMKPRTLLDEATGFHVPASTTAWVMPQSKPGRYTPAYEEFFTEGPAGATAPTPSGWSFPALFRIGGGGGTTPPTWLLISETGVDERNCASRLASAAPDGLYRIRLPEAEEGRGVGSVNPSSPLPWTLPWRVLIVGDSLARLAESTLVEDLSPPSVVKDTSWIRPGRASWSWWAEDNSPRDEKALVAFVDLAADFGWEYSLIDANWNLMAPDALQRVLAHAKKRNVGIVLWYNSGGPHNDVTEQPRDRMHERDTRRAEFAKLREWGVKGVKVDFWQSDKQDRIQQYLDVLRDAADFQLLVNFHGCTLPRGWSRTYPHLVSMEGVMGAEQYKFNERFPQQAASHNTILAFTRNVVGPMDYTPVTFTDHKFPRLTTNGHELALSVVFESGVQHYADSATSYRKLPEPVQAFLKAVPAAWTESRLLAGDPGKQAIFARRAGRTWYIGGINGTTDTQKVDLDLGFLGATTGSYRLTLIGDGKGPREFATTTRSVTAKDRLSMTMQPRGGFVARLDPER